MAAVAGQGTTFNLPNFVGELFALTPEETPFLAQAGGLNGGMPVHSKEFTYHTYDLAAASQPAILEGADPTYGSRSRSEVTNTTQIFQYGVETSYTKQGATGQIGTVLTAASAPPSLGVQPVMNEHEWQQALKLDQAAIDIEYSFIQGTYQKPTDNITGRKTRGINAAITTNTVAAGAVDVTKVMVDALLAEMHVAGAPFRNLVIHCGAWNKQLLTSIYGLAPRDRNVGGMNITQIETSVAGNVGIVLNRHQLASTIGFYDMSVVRPRFMEIPGKGYMFVEPMAKTGAADKAQLYGEVGLEYGPEQWHGHITGTTTA